MHMRLLCARNATVACLIVATVCGCGGGGDGESQASGPDVSFSTTQVNFSSQVKNDLRPPAQIITVSVRSGSVYLRISGYTNASLGCPGGNTCTIQVDSNIPSRPLYTSSTTDVINVKVCSDSFCNIEIRTQAIAVSNVVSNGVLLSEPKVVAMDELQGQTAARAVALTFTGEAPNSASSAASYQIGNGSGWLTTTATPSTLDLAAISLAPGEYQAIATVTYSGAGYSKSEEILVDYTVTATVRVPTVDTVAPYVASVDAPRAVVIRGKNFDRMVHPVTFGGVAAQSTTTISNTELLVVPPSFSVPGAYGVEIANDEGIATTAGRYVVVNESYPADTLNLPQPGAGFVRRRLIYDAERRSVYFLKDRDAVIRAQLQGGVWSVGNIPGISTNSDPLMSVDGAKLYYGSTVEFNLNTFMSGITHTPVIRGHAVVSDGRLFGFAGDYGGLYDFKLQRSIRLPSVSVYVSPGWGRHAVSPDGNRVLAIATSLFTTAAGFDASQRKITIFRPQLNDQTDQIAINRHATRLMIGSRIYDGNYNLLGNLANYRTSVGAVFSPDGNRLYSVSDTNTVATLHVYDVSASQGSYALVGNPITLPNYPGRGPDIAISTDGRTLFVAGLERFIAIPTPN